MPSARQTKDTLFELVAQVAQTIANPHRLELLDLLVQAPRSVEQLAEASALSIANASQHLQRLKRAGLVVSERRGTSMQYHIADPTVARLWVELRTLAEQQLAGMDRALDAYRQQRHTFPQIAADEVRTRLQMGDIVLLDVRPPIEYSLATSPARYLSLSTSYRSVSLNCQRKHLLLPIVAAPCVSTLTRHLS
jgi:DNA-binding transcriptional ArsR family regulator